MWQYIAAGAQMLGGIAEGRANQKQMYRQAALDEFDARNTEEEAERKALSIYTQSIQVKSQQVAQIAASGVVVGDGSASAIVEETDKLARMDAMAALYTGYTQAAATRSGATARVRAGDQALLTGVVKGITSGASTYASLSK